MELHRTEAAALEPKEGLWATGGMLPGCPRVGNRQGEPRKLHCSIFCSCQTEGKKLLSSIESCRRGYRVFEAAIDLFGVQVITFVSRVPLNGSSGRLYLVKLRGSTSVLAYAVSVC